MTDPNIALFDRLADLGERGTTARGADYRPLTSDMVRPYAADFAAFFASPEWVVVREAHMLTHFDENINLYIQQPRLANTTPAAMHWLRTHQRGPWAPATVPQGDSIPPIFTEAAMFGRMGGPTPPGGRDGHQIRVDMAQYIHRHLDQWRDQLTEYVAQSWNTNEAALREVLDAPATSRGTEGILWLPDFARWYIGQHPTTAPTEGAPMTAEIAEFRRRYNLITSTDPHRAQMAAGHDGGNVQEAFIALPTEVKQLWRTLYNEAVGNNLFGFGGVNDFDRGAVATTVYGFSTENFFVYAHTAGITIGDNGGPVIPGAVPQGDGGLVFEPNGQTAATIRVRFAAGEHVFAPVETLFRAWSVRRGLNRQWQDFILTGTNTDGWDPRERDVWDRYWDHDSTNPYSQGFLQYLREHRAEIPTVANNQPAAVPQGDALPEIARLIDAGTLTAASLHGDARFALLAPVRGLVQQWWNESEHASGTEYVDFLVAGGGGHRDAWSRYINGSDDSYLTRLARYLRDHRAEIAPTPQEATIPTTTDQAAPVVVPIGPDHPGWVEFAARMAQVATENSMCPEYDRIAREMGLPTRKTEIVTRITLEVPVTIERGNNVDDRTLREAARALLEQNGTVSRANRTEVRRTETVG